MCNPYDHELDALFEAKHQCGIKNNVIFIREKEIQPYLEYMKITYGTDWKKKFQIKKK